MPRRGAKDAAISSLRDGRQDYGYSAHGVVGYGRI